MSQVFKSRSSPAKLSERDLGESFRTAVIQNETHHVKALLKKITVDYVLDANRKTALYLASQYGHLKIVKFLLNRGANPNYRCADGSTPLHAACYAAHPEIMGLLIDAGGDLRLHDNDGRGVRDWALKHMDQKKARAMICYIEDLYLKVLESNEEGESSPVSSQTSGQKKKMKNLTSSKNSVNLQSIGFGRVRRGQFTYPAQRNRLVEVASWSEEQSTEPSLIPVINETSLVHDHLGVTFTNGSFMVMESMFWNQFITVTVKKLRKVPMGQETGRVDELINENNYMLRVKHANILLLLAVCPVDRFENIILVYERIELGSVHMLLHHSGMRFPREPTCNIFIQICDAVLYLHQNNMIHSYISAHAIVIMSSSHVAKLTNFEYMVDSSGDPEDSSVQVIQTYPAAATKWLAPEILVEKRVSKKTDVYGICVVLWEVLHGRLPFAGLTTAEIEVLLVDAQNRVLPIDAGIETPLNMILDSALKCDPSLRSCKIKDVQNLLEQTYEAAKTDKPLQHYKKQARSNFFEPAPVDCSLGCVLYCDQNGELAELPNTGHRRGLVEQPEWRSKAGGAILEQWEPILNVSDLENSSEAVRHNMRLHKVSAVRKLFKDHVVRDEYSDSSDKTVSAEEVRRRLLLLNRTEPVGEEGAGQGATVQSEDVIRVVPKVRPRKVLNVTDAAVTLPIAEVANDFRKETAVTDVQVPIEANVSDAEEVKVTDLQPGYEEGVPDVAATKQAAEPNEDENEVAADGDSGKVTEESETEEVNVEKSVTLHESTKSEEQPSMETDTSNISPSTCPMFFAVPYNDETKNIPSSVSGVDVISMEQLPSFPVSDDLISPVKRPSNGILSIFRNEEEERIKGDTTTAEDSKLFAPDENLKDVSTSEIGQEPREVEASESAELTVQRVRHSIQMLKRAFFSNNNLSEGSTDPISSTSALKTVQTKKSSSDVSLPLQRLQHLSSNADKDLQFNLNSIRRVQPLAAASVDDTLLPKISGELTADSVEMFKALINKPLPPLPRTYIKQALELKKKSLENATCTAPEFDSADWQRLSTTDKEKNIPLLFPCSRQTRIGHCAYVTSKEVELFVPPAAPDSDSSKSPASGSTTNLSQKRLRSSSQRVHESIQPKTESYVRQSVFYRYDKPSVSKIYPSPPVRIIDFMVGFKPASHHVPSMVAPHLTKRTTDHLVPVPSPRSERMQRRHPLRQEDSTGSYVGYKLDKNLRSDIMEDDNSSPRDVVKGRLERKIAADMEERALKEAELKTDPLPRSDDSPLATTADDATFPKVFAMSAQTFHDRPGPDVPRNAVTSTQVTSGRGAAEGIYKMKVEEVMGDHQVVTPKETDPLVSDLEVHNTQHHHGVRTLTRLAAMKAGTSLTIPPSARISELQDEAEFMHRFKSDPLLQRDAIRKLGDKPAKATELDKTSEEMTQPQQQVSPMTKNGNAADERSSISEGIAVSDGDHAKVFKTSAQVCFQVKPPSGSSDSRATITKEIEEGVPARDEVTWLVDSAIRDALDQISSEYLVSKCPHKANSATAGL